MPLRDTKEIMEELEALDAPVKYIEYERDGHEIWDAALKDGAALQWLFEQSQ